jgi:hypothetical protein
MGCGGVDLIATFLSPVEVRTVSVIRTCPSDDLTETQPTDFVNQSIPLSYLGVEVVSNDGNPHQVQLYTDVDGEWLAQSDQLVQWETTAGDTVTHQFSLQNQTQFGAVVGRLRYGSFIYSTKQVCYSLVCDSAGVFLNTFRLPD